MPDIGTSLRDAAQSLEQSSDSPRLDAEVLLAEVLDKQRSYLLAFPDHSLSPQQTDRFCALLSARRAGTPIAHILGRR